MAMPLIAGAKPQTPSYPPYLDGFQRQEWCFAHCNNGVDCSIPGPPCCSLANAHYAKTEIHVLFKAWHTEVA